MRSSALKRGKKVAKKQNSARTKKTGTTKSKAPGSIPHSWRLCPAGEHWVQTHPLRIPPGRNHPEGHTTTRHGHCALNPSGKDQFYPEEIREIAREHFGKVKNRPCPLELKYGRAGSAYDDLIAGWVQYWNDVLNSDEPLDPSLFKALIASESSFNPTALADKKNAKSARGLTQLLDSTRKILGDEKGELKDHYVTATRDDLYDPSVNICAGVRWLFHKRNLASGKLGRTATWEEAVAEYKSIREGIANGVKRDRELMERFLKRLKDYKKCGK